MKPCYEGLKEIGVDVNEIWRKMLCFRVSIGLLPLLLIVSWNETLLWRFERNQSWCQWDMKENVVFWLSCEMKLCYEGLKEIRVDVNEIWRKILDFGASIGLLPLLLIVLWNETLLWRFERNWSWCQWDMKENVVFWLSHEMKPCYEGLKEIRVDVNEIWRKMLGFRVSIGLLPLLLIVLWNETMLWRFERNQSWCW